MHTENNPMAGDAPEPLRTMRVPDGFAEWLPPGFEFTVLLEHEHDQWYATAEDFTISGVGPTVKAAVMDVIDLVEAYLVAHFEDGQPFAATLRPASISTSTKLEAKLGNILAGVLRGAGERIPMPREKRVPLLPERVCA